MHTTPLQRFSALALSAAVLLAAGSTASAGLLAHWDPNDTANMYADGGSGGGTVPISGTAGDTVGWWNDTVFNGGTKGGASSGFDLQSTNSTVTLANGPGGFVMDMPGDGNSSTFLHLDSGNYDDFNDDSNAGDTDTLIAVTAFKVNSANTNDSVIFDHTFDSLDNVMGLMYDASEGNVVAYADGYLTNTVAQAAGTDQWVVAKVVWDGDNETLSLSLNGGSASSTSVTDYASPAFERTRVGRKQGGDALLFNGQLGDLYFYDTAGSADNAAADAVVGDLVSTYVPEPATAGLLGLGAVMLVTRRKA